VVCCLLFEALIAFAGFLRIFKQLGIFEVFELDILVTCVKAQIQWLGKFGSVAIQRDAFDTKLPGLDHNFFEVFDRGFPGQVDGLGNGAGEQGGEGGDHQDMAHVWDVAFATATLGWRYSKTAKVFVR